MKKGAKQPKPVKVARAKDAVERTRDALADPLLLNEIVVEVAAGGSLAMFCNERKILFRGVLAWLMGDDDRKSAYHEALDVREQHAKDEIIKELFCYLRADVTQAFDDNGNMLRVKDWPRDLQRMLAGMEFQEIFEMQGIGKDRERVHVGTLHKLKFFDKPRTIELFMRNLKMLVDKHEIVGKMSLADLVNEPTNNANKANDQGQPATHL